MEVLFPVRRPLDGVERRGIVAVEDHGHGCHEADVPDVHFLFAPSHLGRDRWEFA
jgi:hypothetical protein